MEFNSKYEGQEVEQLLDIVASGSSSAYPQVNHGTSDTTFTLTPNTYHVWDEVEQLDITLGDEIEGVVNEFVFQFSTGETPAALTLPDGIMWADGTNLVLSPNATYVVSIINGLTTVKNYYPYIVNNIELTVNTDSGYIEWASRYPLATDVHLHLGNGMYCGVMSAGQQGGDYELYGPTHPGDYYCFISFSEDGSNGDIEITDETYLYRVPEIIRVSTGDY